MDEITNTENIIDSRKVIERIDELEACAESEDPADALTPDETAELARLRDLAEQGSTLADWPYGVPLIRDSYFTAYIREMGEEFAEAYDVELRTLVERFGDGRYTPIGERFPLVVEGGHCDVRSHDQHPGVLTHG